ncbi:cytochrome c oxidase assembly protein [Janibacter melonis]|uniref:bifunctional copper resistance protein CopD/cytochrome c oxidase assembly protein n=1 Tax=Janibacter melonis TaxID=262209 RepID=UPI001E412B1F|nr:bifunctional copper resistance protein CopD/cytochrome c oxidase assembly protein [Janibacter melonis]MCB5992301.1 bifunctional copper resistance protein CopD/cytochrome c oxidase assembly protein [Janibacter melonis]
MSTAPGRSLARTTLTLGPALVLALAVVVTTVIGVLVGRAAVPYAAGDPGALVRWGLPVLQGVHDLAAAVTVGFLLLGAFVLPETTRTRRRWTAGRVAATSGTLWLVSLLLLIVLTFADLAGVPVGQPGFATQLAAVLWDLPTLRMNLISAVVVLVVVMACAGSESKAVLGWGWAGSLLALLPLALTGHSSAALDHMSGVNALAIHLVSATVWVGGLVALACFQRGLGAHLGPTIRRYSVVAGWGFAGVMASGLLLAWTNIGALENLLSRYGALLGVKLALGVVLGGFGWWHRQRFVQQLDEGGTPSFVRFVLAELVVMGSAFGIGAAISRTPSPTNVIVTPPDTVVYALSGYPDPGAPTSSSWFTAWQTEWLWLTVALVACVVYVRWVLRLRRRGDSWSLLRTVSWVLGWAVFVYATSGAPGVYGRVSFSWHMIEHMTVAMVVPLLLVPAAPITLALRALPARRDRTLGPRELVLASVHAPYLRVVANPAVAAAIFFFSLAIFYYSPLFGLSMSTHTGHVLMMVHFLLSGYLFVWVLIGVDPGPTRWSPLALLVILFTTISFHAFFGVILTQSTTLLAPDFFGVLDLPWVPDPVADQRTGGEIAWGVGEAPTLVLAVAVAVQWMRSDERESRRRDRSAERDGDRELEAYNAHLASLGQGGAASGTDREQVRSTTER